MLAVLTVMALTAGSPCRLDGDRCGPRPATTETGRVVALSVDVEGRRLPLYAAPDGSTRRYFEASQGASYVLHLRNLTGGRVAVHARVDGLNVVSGEREDSGRPGRMYVLGPWETLDVRGWRSSLEQVHAFTFVDEKRSYVARAGKPTSRLGWIEVDVYRERVREVAQPVTGATRGAARPEPSAEGRARDDASGEYDGAQEKQSAGAAAGRAPAPSSFPGTGWGQATHDPAHVVSFEREARPVETLTLRYEYSAGLRALGIQVGPRRADRLRERDRGVVGGFARPPVN